MLAFIQSQPSVVERLLRHVETPSIVDLLVRIIQLDEVPGGAGVLEVCSYMQHSSWQLTQYRNSVAFVGESHGEIG
jgi:hypothetical protein